MCLEDTDLVSRHGLLTQSDCISSQFCQIPLRRVASHESSLTRYLNARWHVLTHACLIRVCWRTRSPLPCLERVFLSRSRVGMAQHKVAMRQAILVLEPVVFKTCCGVSTHFFLPPDEVHRHFGGLVHVVEERTSALGGAGWGSARARTEIAIKNPRR